MIADGTLQEKGNTEKGTPKAKIDGTWYYGGRGVNFDNAQIGQKLIVEYQPFGDKGLRGVKNWSLHPHQPGAIPKANGPLDVPVNTMTEGERAFASNVCAHAIDKGLIGAHTDLSTWVAAAIKALRHFEDEIPFSEP
jgi:hypothetical protein